MLENILLTVLAFSIAFVFYEIYHFRKVYMVSSKYHRFFPTLGVGNGSELYFGNVAPVPLKEISELKKAVSGFQVKVEKQEAIMKRLIEELVSR